MVYRTRIKYTAAQKGCNLPLRDMLTATLKASGYPEK